MMGDENSLHGRMHTRCSRCPTTPGTMPDGVHVICRGARCRGWRGARAGDDQDGDSVARRVLRHIVSPPNGQISKSPHAPGTSAGRSRTFTGVSLRGSRMARRADCCFLHMKSVKNKMIFCPRIELRPEMRMQRGAWKPAVVFSRLPGSSSRRDVDRGSAGLFADNARCAHG